MKRFGDVVRSCTTPAPRQRRPRLPTWIRPWTLFTILSLLMMVLLVVVPLPNSSSSSLRSTPTRPNIISITYWLGQRTVVLYVRFVRRWTGRKLFMMASLDSSGVLAPPGRFNLGQEVRNQCKIVVFMCDFLCMLNSKHKRPTTASVICGF
jgi:hypothetical protein